jgi:hypothetical protein
MGADEQDGWFSRLTDQVNSSGNSPIPTEKGTVMRVIRGFQQTRHVSKATVKTTKHNAAPIHAMTSYKTRDVQLHSFFTSAVREGVNFAPRPLYPRGPMTIMLVGPQSQSVRFEKKQKKILTP